MIYDSYNEFHLGDNLVHLHFLRKLAELYPEHLFRHWLHPCHAEQLQPVVSDLANVELHSAEAPAAAPGRDAVTMEGPGGAPRSPRNVWKNADGFWQGHPLRNDWANFHVEWFKKLSAEMHLDCPILTTHDLLFDYPAIASGADTFGPGAFDVLFVNSQPCSGQFLDFDSPFCLDPMIEALQKNGLKVISTSGTANGICTCTRDYGMDLTAIGHLSLTTPHHIMVATGPMWPTFNIWGQPKTRLVMIGVDEVLTLPLDIQHVKTRAAAMERLQGMGLI